MALRNAAAYENACLRCGRTVYQVDKVGPLKDFTFFHKGCLKCRVCGSKLTLKTYFNNQQDNDDKEVSERITIRCLRWSLSPLAHDFDLRLPLATRVWARERDGKAFRFLIEAYASKYA